MAKVYSRVTKINNVTGRSDYISNPDRQEFLKLTGKSRDFEWKEYAEFEKENQKSQEKNNEARELVIALPNEMSESFSDKILEEFSHDLAQELLGENRDYEFALHWNKTQTNFHMHLLFSERERKTERIPKVYKRDMWFDKTTNRMAKANAENAELRHEKGETMKDKQGNIRYDEAPFTKKDSKFTERSWLKSHQETIQNVAVLNPKKETGNVSISVSFFGKIRQAFFRRFRRKKHTHYSLTFFDILIEEGKINI